MPALTISLLPIPISAVVAAATVAAVQYIWLSRRSSDVYSASNKLIKHGTMRASFKITNATKQLSIVA
jgi:hypothetical protein